MPAPIPGPARPSWEPALVRPEDIPSGARVRIMGGPAAHQVCVLYQDQPAIGICQISLAVEAGRTCQATLHYTPTPPDVDGPCLKQVVADIDPQAYAGTCPG